MTEKLPVTYINCDFCTAKNHCAACGAELSESLERKPGIARAQVNLPDRSLLVDHSLSGDDLEDILDGMGLLIG